MLSRVHSQNVRARMRLRTRKRADARPSAQRAPACARRKILYAHGSFVAVAGVDNEEEPVFLAEIVGGPLHVGDLHVRVRWLELTDAVDDGFAVYDASQGELERIPSLSIVGPVSLWTVTVPGEEGKKLFSWTGRDATLQAMERGVIHGYTSDDEDAGKEWVAGCKGAVVQWRRALPRFRPCKGREIVGE